MKIAYVLVALLPAVAAADDSNFRPYLIGSRAGGMGGAFTALADDPSGPYYNPAGIAYVQRTQLSLSGSLFGVLSTSTKDALGDGRDFDASDLQTFPIQTSAVYKIGDDAKTSPDALAFSIFVPTSSSVDDRDNLGTTSSSFTNTIKEDDVWIGLSYAHRFGRLSIGASAYALFETYTQALELNAVSPSDSGAFANIEARDDETRLGVVGAFGIRVDVSEEISIGAAIYSPEVGAYDKRKLYVRGASGDIDGQPSQSVIRHSEDLHSTPTLPARLQTGIAWSSGSVTLTADCIVLFPREVRDDEDMANIGFDRWIKRNLVVNGAAGMEILLTPSVPLRAGFWTDLSAADDPSADGPDNTTRLDRVGGSLALGFRSEHTETSLNLNVAYAWGDTLIPDNLDFTALKKTSESQVGVYAIVASSFQF